jgi:precorrin-2 dehydrogenase/sirohydrochlorin ferrochelatase
MTDNAYLSAMTQLYPVFLDLRGKRCVVVGGGQVARRKVESLVEAGAEVTVVAPRVEGMPVGVRVIARAFKPDDLDGARFVIAATDDPRVNAEVANAADTRGIWVNAVDDPVNCTVILPAVVRRGAFVLAISTGGSSPAFARRLRERLEREFGPEYGEFVSLLWTLRRAWEPRAKAAGLPNPARQRAWETVLDLPLLDWLREGDRAQAEREATRILKAALRDHGEERVE